ncbi:slipin family protein [Roseovarius rhodophyticola]|uniref:Slipin family protein n=1 Tax=Roseovarius rhodophyticola TaxID=3080827 RepID=A0ABZ2TG39_9RHOB|nr:slipin family protein [Roseovarius sp. W115]MDV2928973.1 slipin family protein [Roseovarius sp. W115]
MTHVLTRTLDRLTGHERVTLMETERMLVLTKGRITAILGPGEHRLKARDTVREVHNIERLRFTSPYTRVLFRERADLAEAHLTEVRAGEGEVAVILREGVPYEVLLPDTRLVLWTVAGPWTVERHALTDTLDLPTALARRLTRTGLTTAFNATEVAEGHVGMLTVDGVLMGRLAPGTHAFWKVGRHVAVKQVDLRTRTHEVTGQEILTKDRVTIRVNLTADYRVTDPERAVGAVKDFEEALHRALQLAFRKTLGALTLDRLLAEKVTVDAEAAKTVRAEMARIGIEVGEIALKDVILPGEMREILTAVVAAEKEAEANVIRRREETNATRSLLNTAKVMAENPVMLRLKELEALETIAGKVERLTVHNGTEGLMTDLVRLRD